MNGTTAAPIERLDTSALSRRWSRHPVSIGRYVEQKILARPHFFLGRKMWFLHEVEEAEKKLAAIAPARQRVGGVALAASGRAARDLSRQLREAAAEALAAGGVALVGRVLAPFAEGGRLDQIASERKAEAADALRRAVAAVAEVRPPC